MDVCGVFAVEREREFVGRFHAKKCQRSQLSGLAMDVITDNAIRFQRAQHEISDGIVAYSGEGDRAQAEPARANGDVGRATADHRIEAGGICEVSTDVLAEEIHVHPTEGDEVVCQL